MIIIFCGNIIRNYKNEQKQKTSSKSYKRAKWTREFEDLWTKIRGIMLLFFRILYYLFDFYTILCMERPLYV